MIYYWLTDIYEHFSLTEAYSEHCQTSAMKAFAKTVNGWMPLTIFGKGFILHVWQSFGCTSTWFSEIAPFSQILFTRKYWKLINFLSSFWGVFTWKNCIYVKLDCFTEYTTIFWVIELGSGNNKIGWYFKIFWRLIISKETSFWK